MKEGAAYQAASHQSVELSSGTAVPPLVETEKARAKARPASAVPGLTFPRFLDRKSVV